ncbi:MAG: Crp/Fnr family transcriptional regulator [Candidatus Saccharibacteria bacterium]
MTDAVRDKIDKELSKYPRRTYPKGQILVFADESPAYVFYLVEGRVREYDVSYRGNEVIVNIFKPNSFFPMSWALNHTPNKYFYKTESATVLHIVPVEAALAFAKSNPDVLLDLLSRVYAGMDGLLGRLVHLMSGTAQSRLIFELITGSQRFGVKAKDGSYLLNSSEVDIAARSGLSRETVSREMRKLKDEQLVDTSKGNISIKSLTKLQNKLGTEEE